jgi:aminopeptidase
MVRVGANVQRGQDVFLEADVDQIELVRLITDQAYAAGARRVVTQLDDDWLTRSAIAHGADDALRSTYRYELEMVSEYRERGAAAILLYPVPDPATFEGLDPDLITAPRAEFNTAWGEALGRGEIAWSIAVAPNATWAREVFGEPDLDRLWDAVATAMRLDDPDPIASWHQRVAELHARRDQLNGLRLKAIHVRGSNTDLKMSLVEDAVWQAGGMDSTSGIYFMPNMPTEEIFTSPDFRRTTGSVQVTAPVALGAGSPVTGLRLIFEDGRVTDVQAETGRDLVLAQLAQDEQASFLGEIALVDAATSGVARAGVLFRHPLLDENVSSHIALGSAYEITVPSLAHADEATRLAAGLNVCPIHTDVAIGGPGVEIDGLAADDVRIPLIRDDRWALAAD